MTQRIAVLGATGFVGRNVVQALRRRGLEPVSVTAPRLGDDECMAAHSQYLKDAIQDCRAIINAAGISTPTAQSGDMTSANARLPGLVALVARDLNIRFVHISSAAVQGNREILDSDPISQPFSPYSQSKADGEAAVLATGGEAVIYRPPGVHGPDRAVTRQVGRLARSPLAAVARPRSSPTAQAWITNVADAAAYLATCSQTPPRIVHHPHEGMTTGMMLEQLGGGRTPLTLPTPVARRLLAVARLAARWRPSLVGHVRRLEVLWFGQLQAPSWLTDRGWQPPLPPNKWSTEMQATTQTRPAIPRLLYGITAPSAVDILLRGQLRHMKDNGWQVHLVSNDGPQARAAAIREGVAAFHPIKMSRAITPLADALALTEWIRILRRVRPDAVNISSPKAGLLGSLASYMMRVPTRVYVLRGARFETTHGVTRKALLHFERVALHCATEVLAISPSLKDLYVEAGLIPDERITVLRSGSSNGIPAEDLRQRYASKDRMQLRAQYLGPHSDKYCVLFLGRVTHDKGISDLTQAMQQEHLRDAVLLVVGEEEETIPHPSFDELQTAGRLIQVPHLEDVTEAFAVADILCLPSYREGLGNVVLEASAVGLPVVGTRVTGVIDAIQCGKTGRLARVNDPHDLGEQIAAVRESPELALRYGLAGTEWVARNFAPEAIWRDLNDIYRNRLP